MADVMPPPERPPDIVATMAFDPLAGISDLDAVLEGMKADAVRTGRPFDRHAVRNDLQAATFRLREARTIRLLLSPSGAIAVEISPVG